MSEEFRAKEMNTYEYDRLSDTSSISSMYDSDASLLKVKRLTLQLQETLPFEI